MSGVITGAVEGAGLLGYLLAGLVTAIPLGPAEAVALSAGSLSAQSAAVAWGLFAALALGLLAGDVGVFLAVRVGGNRLLDRWMPATSQRISARGTEPGATAAAPAARPPAASRPGSRRRTWWCLVVMLGRFVPGMRTPAAIAAALGPLGAGSYLMLSAVGSGLWALMYLLAGRLMAHMALPLPVVLAVGILVLVLCALALRSKVSWALPPPP